MDSMADAARTIFKNIDPKPARAALIQTALKRTAVGSSIWCIGLLPMHAAIHFTAPDVWFFK
jgi:hypothetical protein